MATVRKAGASAINSVVATTEVFTKTLDTVSVWVDGFHDRVKVGSKVRTEEYKATCATRLAVIDQNAKMELTESMLKIKAFKKKHAETYEEASKLYVEQMKKL